VPTRVNALAYLFARDGGPADRLWPRWLFLRGLGAVYLSAFVAVCFQARGLVGEQGVLPAASYLAAVARLGAVRWWYAPTVLWFTHGDAALVTVGLVGAAASVLLLLNVLPRAMLAVCWVCFLSFIAVAQDFGEYQSDGMLLEAGFLALFLAPAGVRPGLGERSLPVRAALWLLVFEWFRIYFQSGVVKLQSGDRTWRNLTAMYEYYQNGPLPTWIGWYLQHLPFWFQRATAGATLAMELGLVWMAWGPRRWRLLCFGIVTAWQAGVILSANYAFLNYLVLLLGFLLLDDMCVRRFLPARLRVDTAAAVPLRREALPRLQPWVAGFVLVWVAYAAVLQLANMLGGRLPLPATPAALLAPFRIANSYGLFATMTPHRYEIQFQGSNDGQTWAPYLFRFKPQRVDEAPGIYAPYQPRFDWNLWFASLGPYQQSPIVLATEERLLQGSPAVLGLFRENPFPAQPPRFVRAVLWQYWFTSMAGKRSTGAWWRRTLLGTYAPTLERLPDGRFAELQEPALDGPPAP
jgi:lipase maturation factor 1